VLEINSVYYVPNIIDIGQTTGKKKGDVSEHGVYTASAMYVTLWSISNDEHRLCRAV